MGFFSFLFGNKANKIKDFTDRDAIILDVRSKAEYDSGAIPGSKHIPLQQVQAKINQIKAWKKPVITCCASGMRSGSAASILRSNGIEVTNGGGWQSLYKKL
ncbi:rhodanese-like domain-containing protein [Olleya aquimaris]|uniref:Rhodanese-like domain-containing protein n=1 Tax=Olleya sediminilitoris TaxID=2795739 RepID=A0ABS1WJF7_9FLAO|nr:rhodanese-like domain-containing protein [Olleya sediminilitoris]AXO81330.1 rhodanese-like domain-containing protein [Olleya aquimaris]MBL7559257.1 rhodanese-like domain-containing protein [Olleya sediminilitoris]